MAGKTQGRARVRARGNRKHRSSLFDRAPSFADIRGAIRGWLGRHKRLLFGIATALVALAAALGAITWLATSPRFDIKNVEASGQRRLPSSVLEERLEIGAPVNVFRYDTAAAEERLEASPWVKEARVRRAFPSGLRVTLVENEPVAIASMGELYLIDADGVPFKQATVREAAALDLIIITGLPREMFRRDPDQAAERLARAVSLSSAWKAANRPVITEINIDDVRGFTLIPDDGRPAIRVGDGGDGELEPRLELFDLAWSALSQKERDDAEFVHLDTAPTPNRVAIAFVPTARTASSSSN